MRVIDSITCFRPWGEHISLYSFDILELPNTFMLKSPKLYTSCLSKLVELIMASENCWLEKI